MILYIQNNLYPDTHLHPISLIIHFRQVELLEVQFTYT